MTQFRWCGAWVWMSLWGCQGAPPELPEPFVQIVPAKVGPQTKVACRDVSGAPVKDSQNRSVSWLRNGEPAGTGPQLAGPHAPGDVLACEVGFRVGGETVRLLRDEAVVHNGELGQNVVLIILDDVGVERVGAYDVEDLAPPMPTLNRIAERGVLFLNAYANPVCSPTRAGMLTGLHSQNNGVGTAIADGGTGLGFGAWTLPEALDELTKDSYSHAAVGKWHVSGRERGLDNPVEHGFDRFAGTMANLGDYRNSNFTDWYRVEHGREERVRTYATTDTVDTTLAYMKELPEPFFLWVAFHASHAPFHVPPPQVFDGDLGRNPTVPEKYNAALTAMDKEIGRMLASMPREQRERTTFIIIGDNGTPQYAAEAPYDVDRVKSTMYEGGIRVPMLVMGPTVVDPGRRSEALVSHVDIFPTVLELAGAVQTGTQAEDVDGVSFASQLSSGVASGERRYLYQENFAPNGRNPAERVRWNRVLRDRRWKYTKRLSGREELYDLRAHHLDNEDLMTRGVLEPEAQDAFDRLRRVMTLDFEPRPVESSWW